LSYRCVVFADGDLDKLQQIFARELRDSAAKGFRGVVLVVHGAGIRDLIPRVRDALLNNVAMGVRIYTTDLGRDEVFRELRKLAEMGMVGEARVYACDGDVAKRLAERLRQITDRVEVLCEG